MDKLSYALGLSMGHNFLGSGIKSLNVEDFAKGVEAVYKQEKPEISFDEAKKIINEFFSNLQDEIAETGRKRIFGRECQAFRCGGTSQRFAI